MILKEYFNGKVCIMKISIIGSFRKYYTQIKDIIDKFEKSGIEVLSPKSSEITHSVEDFVIFKSDDKRLLPSEIQTETLNRILKSDMVYVYDPDGYVGRTTCYEIGVIRTTTIPIFFLEKPKDLPIDVGDNEVMNCSELIYVLLNDLRFGYENSNKIFIDKEKIKNSMKSKNIVICGSMTFYEKMLEVSEYLKYKGVPVVIPREENEEKNNLSQREFNEFKRKVSNQYLAKIRESSTYAILVLNQEKREIPNYIGANTLVEISMAFCWGRPIYLFNNFYTPLLDELVAWNAIELEGNLDILVENYKRDRYSIAEKKIQEEQYDNQIELGDIDEHFYSLFR